MMKNDPAVAGPGKPKLVAVPFSFDYLIELITFQSPSSGGNGFSAELISGGLPADAAFIYSFVKEGRVAYLVFSHSSFRPLAEGEPLPELNPTFRRRESIQPIPGLRIEISGPGEVVITRDPTQVVANYSQPMPPTQLRSDESGALVASTQQASFDTFTFENKDISLQERVKCRRKLERGGEEKTNRLLSNAEHVSTQKW